MNTISKSLGRIIGKTENNNSPQLEFKIGNKIVNDSLEIANSFNTFFTSIGRSLAKNIQSTRDPISYIDTNINEIIIPEITDIYVKQIITSLKDSAPGYDELPGSIMKRCSEHFITPLVYLINTSLRQGIFPKELKVAKIIPIYKSDNEQLIENYRPISVLPYFSKIYEKIVSLHVTDFLENDNILYDKQFGFRRYHSTSHAIITLVDKVSKALDSGKFVVGVFLDLKKAFDTVDHGILLNKLYALGIRGDLHKWFKSYLSGRSQYVYYNDNKSDVLPITHGVPQGSILGPLLFIIYVNDFSKCSDLLFSILFADDTSVFLEGQTYTGVIELMNNELVKVDEWLKSNKLTINTKKTEYMIFHRSRIKQQQKSDVIIKSEIIHCSTSTKFLGVIIDNKLKWTEHIMYIKNKISKSIGILYKIRNFINKQTLINLYHTFVFPYIIYCIEIWGNACHTYLDCLIKQQKKIIRIITFSYYTASTGPLFDSLNILRLEKLVIHRISLMMYKFSCNMLPSPVMNLFIRNNELHNHFTRQSSFLHTPIGDAESIYRTFRFHAIRIWNHIEVNIPVDVSYVCFKKISKTYIQKNNDMLCRLNI